MSAQDQLPAHFLAKSAAFLQGFSQSLKGKSLIDAIDAKGKAMVREYIAAAMKKGSAWMDCYCYKPGLNGPVRKVQSGRDFYIVGSGVDTE